MAKTAARRSERRKTAYRKRNQNRFSMALVTLVVALITVAVAASSVSLRKRYDELSEKEAYLEQQIQAEDERAVKIEEERKYRQTKAYYEEVAKEKLGLVYEGEIVFKEED